MKQLIVIVILLLYLTENIHSLEPCPPTLSRYVVYLGGGTSFPVSLNKANNKNWFFVKDNVQGINLSESTTPIEIGIKFEQYLNTNGKIDYEAKSFSYGLGAVLLFRNVNANTTVPLIGINSNNEKVKLNAEAISRTPTLYLGIAPNFEYKLFKSVPLFVGVSPQLFLPLFNQWSQWNYYHTNDTTIQYIEGRPELGRYTKENSKGSFASNESINFDRILQGLNLSLKLRLWETIDSPDCECGCCANYTPFDIKFELFKTSSSFNNLFLRVGVEVGFEFLVTRVKN